MIQVHILLGGYFEGYPGDLMTPLFEKYVPPQTKKKSHLSLIN